MQSDANLDSPPTTMEIARFAMPALGTWLISPMMSLVDTSVVGTRATSLELAALGPATMVGDACSYLLSFLSVATTNLVATQLAAYASPESVADTVKMAAQLAVACGLLSVAFQIGLGRSILSQYTAERSALLVVPAFSYVRIRALGAPAALLSKVGIAACLATKDSLTPLLAISVSGAINLILTTLLVPSMGIAGAAWATLASELACASGVLCVVWRKLHSAPTIPGARRTAPSPSSSDATTGPDAVAVSAASATTFATFVSFAKPLLLVLLGKIATYSSLAHVATSAGVTSTAAHRVLMSVYWFAWPFAEVCSQVGQTFLPAEILRRRRRRGGTDSASAAAADDSTRQTDYGSGQQIDAATLERKLLLLGSVAGLACAGAAGVALILTPQIFTFDAAVASAVRSLAPLVCGSIAQLGLMCAMEGALLASRDLRFLGNFYTLNAVAMVGAFALVERLGLGLHAAWGCMLGFQACRLLAFGLRLTSKALDLAGADGCAHGGVEDPA
jgi:Na+-driven multidrug efflux pump